MDIFYRYKGLTLLVLLLSGTALFGQEVKLNKTIEKSFPISEKGSFYLTSSYGDIIINGWDKNEVAVEILIEVSHKKNSTAQDLMNRIDIDFKETNDFVSVTSIISDAKKSLISRMFNDINPIELDKPNIKIDYTIYIPKTVRISLENKFGDIIVSDYNSELTTNLSHGNLWVNQDLLKANLTLSYAKLKAQKINEALIQSNNCKLNVASINSLNLKSKGTEIAIENVKKLNAVSKNDEITISEVETIFGEFKYSTIKIDALKDKVDVKLQLADLTVLKIVKDSPIIKINQKSSTIALNIAETNLNLTAFLEDGYLNIPNTFVNVKTNFTNKTKNKRTIKAVYGASSKKGELTITGVKGKILIKD